MNSNKFDRILTTIVTAGLMLDWVPSYFFHIDSSILSGTKIVIPLIILDILVNNKYYSKPNYGWLFILAFLIGVGGGVLLGNVSYNWFWQLLPIGPVLLFYQKPRDVESIKNILRISFFTSLLMPISLLLTYLKILNPSVEVIGNQGQFLRISAGTSWSTIGLIALFISSTLGGILVIKNPYRLKRQTYFFGALIIILSLGSLFLTGLKSAIGAFLITFLISFIYANSLNKHSKIVFFLFVVFVSILFSQPIIKMFLLNSSRYENLNNGTVTIASRIEQWHFFLWHLVNKHTLWPIGMGNAMRGRGPYSYTHFILGEAYFFGGLIFLAVLFVGFYKAISRLSSNLTQVNIDASHKSTFIVLLSLLIGFMLVLTVMPGLHTRITYMVLGMCLSFKRRNKSRDRPRKLI